MSAPLKRYLQGLGYEVQAEVGDIDLAARRGDELIAVELKKRLELRVLLQAVDRQRVADAVYVALPSEVRSGGRKLYRKKLALLRRLDLGLLIVHCTPSGGHVEPVFHPGKTTAEAAVRRDRKRRRSVLSEIDSREVDLNDAGMAGGTRMTAYREAAFFVACCLARSGESSIAELRAFGTGPKTASILQKNYYNWFRRIGRGRYRLSPSGEAALDSMPALRRFYDERIRSTDLGGSSRPD
jgi:hypothetical protein